MALQRADWKQSFKFNLEIDCLLKTIFIGSLLGIQK